MEEALTPVAATSSMSYDDNDDIDDNVDDENEDNEDDAVVDGYVVVNDNNESLAEYGGIDGLPTDGGGRNDDGLLTGLLPLLVLTVVA